MNLDRRVDCPKLYKIYRSLFSEIYKTFLLTKVKVDENGEDREVKMINIKNIRISMSALASQKRDFGVVDVARFLEKEANHKGRLIILHTSGTAVSDSTSTKGIYYQILA